MSVYIVIENGDSYPVAYSTYAMASNAVKDKHRATLDEQYDEFLVEQYDEFYNPYNHIDVAENTQTGKTYLYIEKGIHIYIYKLTIT